MPDHPPNPKDLNWPPDTPAAVEHYFQKMESPDTIMFALTGAFKQDHADLGPVVWLSGPGDGAQRRHVLLDSISPPLTKSTLFNGHSFLAP